MIQGSGEQWGRYNFPRMPSKIHWLVVEPPLWKIWKSVGIILPNWIGKEHVPNHQPGPWLRLKKCWKQSWIRYFDPSPTAPKGVNSTNPAATSTDYHRACSNAYSTMFPYFCHPSIAFSAKTQFFFKNHIFPIFLWQQKLVGGIPTPLKNMTSSVGMMPFPTEWKVIKFHGSSHHQPDKSLLIPRKSLENP